MGQPKQLLPFGTNHLLDLALAAVAFTEIERTLVVLGAHEQKITDKLWLDEYEVISNENWQKGMITSVKAGLNALGDWPDWVIIHPCDYALVERATVGSLLVRALSLGDATPMVRPCFYGKSGHPIMLGRSTLDAVRSLDDGVGLDSIVQAYKPEGELVEVSDPTIHFDIDTPDDYQRALNAWQARRETHERVTQALTEEHKTCD